MSEDTHRSTLFHHFGLLTKEFNEHLYILWGFSTQQKKVILKHFPSLLSAYTHQRENDIREQIVSEMDCDPQDVVKVLQVLLAISRLWDPIQDTASVTLKDFEGSDALPANAKQKKAAISFCKSFFQLLEKDSGRKLRKSTSTKGLKNLIGFSSMIDFRMIIDSEFDWQADDPKKYKPSCKGFVPVAILRIKFDEGDPIIFQCQREDLEMMSRKLLATFKEMKLGENKYKNLI